MIWPNCGFSKYHYSDVAKLNSQDFSILVSSQLIFFGYASALPYIAFNTPGCTRKYSNFHWFKIL